MPFPTALDPFACNRYEIAEFARDAHELGVDYIGLCCGAAPHHVRSLAEALGRTPPGSRYSPDMSKHAYFGTDESLRPRTRVREGRCKPERREVGEGGDDAARSTSISISGREPLIELLAGEDRTAAAPGLHARAAGRG